MAQPGARPTIAQAAPVVSFAPPAADISDVLATKLVTPVFLGLMSICRHPVPRDLPSRAQNGAAMAEPSRIMVVDDEPEICEMLADYLGHAGFEIRTAEDGAVMRRALEEWPADLVILDINMPGEDGLSLARYLRAQTDVGIVMLTAAGEVVDRIVGLEMGADDYIAKPVDLRELLARIRAVLRRRTAVPATRSEAPATQRVPFGACQLDLDAHRLFDASGEEVPITSMEFDLLKAFAEHPNRVLSRDQLLDLAHNRDWEPFDRSIDIRIARLRRKIESDPSKPQVIKTVRGAGYVFVPDGE